MKKEFTLFLTLAIHALSIFSSDTMSKTFEKEHADAKFFIQSYKNFMAQSIIQRTLKYKSIQSLFKALNYRQLRYLERKMESFNRRAIGLPKPALIIRLPSSVQKTVRFAPENAT